MCTVKIEGKYICVENCAFDNFATLQARIRKSVVIIEMLWIITIDYKKRTNDIN